MSLINDALKRASQSDRNRQRPVETHARMEPAAERPGRSLSMVLGVAVVVAVVLAGWFFWQWWNASHATATAVVEIQTVATKPAPAPAPVVHEAAPPPPVVAVPTPAPAPVTAPLAAPEPAPAPPPKPAVETWPVELKLMGIFFSKTNPRALINGKTVSVDDEIEGIRVTKIEHDRVTVEWKGKVKELVIE